MTHIQRTQPSGGELDQRLSQGATPSNFRRLPTITNVAPVLAELDANPTLWDQHPERRTADGTAHAAMNDIWLRFRAKDELTEPGRYAEPHFASWYPAAALLPSAKALALDLLALTRSVYLGGVLITRLPPGGRIEPHVDRGWHPEFHNLKVYVPLRSNAECLNYSGDDVCAMLPGEVWSFNNLVPHSVENNSAEERVNMIVCLRHE